MRNSIVLTILILMPIAMVGCSGGEQEAAETAQAVKDKVEEVETAAGHAPDPDLEACRTATNKLGGALKTALQGAMKKDGPLGAVNVCYDEAEAISNRICDEEGLTVGRVSRRYRNPSNEPDDWEKAGLESFDARIASGEKPQDLEMWATVTSPDGVRTFRYLKAIGTASLCLKCHGGEIAGDLDAKLTELYPEDMARGFATGDLRGAFTVKKVLPADAGHEG